MARAPRWATKTGAKELKGRRSKFELYVEEQLPPGTKFEPERLPYQQTHYYKPDYVLPNGIRIEAKGYFKPSDRTKVLRVIEQNPEIDLRIIFSNASLKLSKNSKTTYGDWATKHGIKWCEAHPLKPRLKVPAKRVPLDWIHE